MIYFFLDMDPVLFKNGGRFGGRAFIREERA